MIAGSLRRLVALTVLLGAIVLLAGVASANTAPDTPDSPDVKAGENSLNVSWEAPGDGGSAITDYDVQYSSDNGTTWTNHAHSGTSTSTTISGLTNGTYYEVQVRATNANGSSEWSFSGGDIPTDLPGKPTSVSVSAGDQKLTASWTAPTDKGGGTIKSYETQYCSSSCDDSSKWQSGGSTSDGSTTSYEITGLTNGTTYQVQVRAQDSDYEDGPWSSSATGTPSTTPGQPGTPTITVGENRLTASWSAPSDDGGSAITGYDVEYCDNTSASTDCSTEDSSDWTSISHSGTGTTTTKTGLTNGTEYYFHVRAKNANGAGSWSSYGSGKPTDLPGAPTSVSVTAGDQQLAVSWTAPTDKGGDDNTISQYNVRYCSGTCSNDSNWTSEPGDSTTSYTIRNLTNGTTYKVQVQAVDSDNDHGPWSSSVNGTPAGAPDTPSDPTLSGGNKQIAVSWTAPNNNGATITDYDVQYSTDESTWTDANHSGTTRSKTISGLTNGTRYHVQVRATNSSGSSSWSSSAQATPDAAPGKPANPTVTIGDGQLSVSWTAPSNSGSAINGYDVHYKKTSDSDWTDTYHSSKTTSTLISGLENGTSYQVRVRAYNNIKGSWSNSVSATPNILPDAPDNPTVTRGNGSLSVSWTEPSNSGSAITGYVVRRCSGSNCDTETNPTWTTKNVSGRTTTSTTLSSLTNGTEYSVQVAAKNTAGTGSFSGSTTGTPATTPGTPTGVSATRGDESLSVSWTAPTSNGGSAITGYDVGYCSSNCGTDGNWTLEEEVSGTSTTISSLTNGTTYKVRVRATNDVGDSSWSSQATGTPNVLPGKPTKPTLAVKDRSLGVSWSAPSNSGSAITDYDVQYCAHKPNASTNPNDCTKSTATWTEWNSSNTSTTRSATITSLINGTEYHVQVSAQNAAGNGSWSASSKATPNTAPAKPSAPTVTRANASLSVSWSAPTNHGTAITGYDVRHCDKSKDCTDDGNWTTKNVNATPTSTTISSLTNGTTYKVEVRAINLAGNGSWSNSTEGTPATTPGKPSMGAVTNGDEQVTATWSAPTDTGGSAITDYDVRYCVSDEKSPAACVGDWTIWKASQTSTALSATITGLTNGTEYLLAARAANVAGEGSWSSHTWGDPDVVPGKPKSVAVASGDKQIIVTWSAADTDGSAITGYDLGTCTGACSNDSDWSVNFLSVVYTRTVTKHPKNGSPLVNGTTYKVRIAAVNDHGTGPWSAIVSGKAGKLPGVPTSVSVTAGNTQLAVSWSAPSDSGTGAISDYDVQYKKSTESTWTEWNASNTSTTTSATITGLTNDTQYDVQVRAQTEYGHSAWSSTTAGTPDVVPGTPGAPTLTRGNTQLSVSWSAPTNSGSAISDYDVQYCEHKPNASQNANDCTKSSGTWTEWNSSNTSTTRSATITGLTNGAEYYVQVRAQNAAGNGAWSSSRKATPATKPSAPSPTVSAGHRQLVVSWDAPSDGGDDISDYDVQYKKSSVSTWTDANHSGTGTTKTISSLTNGTTYHVQVRATNSVGDSSWSGSVSGTPDQVPRKPSKPTLTRGDQQLSVSWSAPTNNGTDISDYDVQYKKSTDSDWTRTRSRARAHRRRSPAWTTARSTTSRCGRRTTRARAPGRTRARPRRRPRRARPARRSARDIDSWW